MRWRTRCGRGVTENVAHQSTLEAKAPDALVFLSTVNCACVSFSRLMEPNGAVFVSAVFEQGAGHALRQMAAAKCVPSSMSAGGRDVVENATEGEGGR